MNWKILSVLLALSLFGALRPTASAKDVPHGPPPWVSASEYAVFPASTVYQEENWALVETLRADAAAGELRPSAGGRTSMHETYSAVCNLPEDAGVCFELGLIEMKYDLNSGAGAEFSDTVYRFNKARKLSSAADGQAYLVAELWDARSPSPRGAGHGACAVSGGVFWAVRILDSGKAACGHLGG